jgi:two-component system sensor histidine kinase KdpD
MRVLNSVLSKIIIRHLAAVLAVLAATWIIRQFQAFLPLQIIVLLYLLPVMICTALWGLTPGVLASMLAFLAFNYYFIVPYHTFQVHNTSDLITLIIFLIVAVVMSQLIGQAREGTRLALSREWEATRMYQLISGLAGLQDAKSVAAVLAAHTSTAFACLLVQADVPGTVEEAPLNAPAPYKSIPADSPTLSVPLRTIRGSEGELRIWRQKHDFSEEEKRLLEAFTSQGALALERVRLSQGMNKARVLEESDRLKSSLLNSVSHELRSPLAAIKASVSSLRSGAVEWESPARDELLETVEEETDHLNLLVGNLLDMSRIDSGALKLNLRWNSIEEIVRGVTVKMRKALQEHRLVFQISAALPLVPTDYVMMEQVFTNLLSNSVKYAPAGTEITIRAFVDAEQLHVTVVNEGPLVAVDHLERIFEKFHRVTEADRITGTGLGLSICKGIVEAHHGQIWAANQACCFEFHFLLPLTINGALPEHPKEATNG